MARPRKSTTPTTATIMNTNETVNISDYCKAQSLSEQSFRLVLENIRPDDFDAVKSVPQSDIDYVVATLTSHTTSTK